MRTSLLPIAAALLCLSQSALALPLRVWANSGEDKVLQEETRLSSGQSVASRVFDPASGTISLTCAQNEVTAASVIIEAPETALSGVTVTLDKLIGPAGQTLQSAPRQGDGVFDWTGREIELFYVRYLQIKGLSRNASATYNEGQVPSRMQVPGYTEPNAPWARRTGAGKHFPDIAVPMEVIPGQSFAVAQGQSQAVWCDIYVPKGAAPGVYTGVIRVASANPAAVVSLPIRLLVHSFALPDMPSAKTMVYFLSGVINKRYLSTPGNGYIDFDDPTYPTSKLIRDRHFMLMHRHKLSLVDDNYPEVNNRPNDDWLDRLSGRLFTSANGYEGPGAGVGNNVFAIGPYGGWQSSWGTSAQQIQSHVRPYANWFAANSPATDRFVYLDDESTNYTQLEQFAQACKGIIPTFATVGLDAAAAHVPSLSIPGSTVFTAPAGIWERAARHYAATDDGYMLYNGHRPATGTFATEDDGTALRQLAWSQYKKRVKRWFFWNACNWDWFSLTDPSQHGATNVFQTAKTFGGVSNTADPVNGETGALYSNGDGLLVYPGTDTVYPAESYNLKGPIASLRMKFWRRGIQDVDYLTLAAKIDPMAVQTIVSQMLPKTLWEYGWASMTDPGWQRTGISWNIDPDAWDAAREQLAAIIENGVRKLAFEPMSGSVGNHITISGAIGSVTNVTLNSTALAYNTKPDGSIDAVVPARAASGPITVTSSAGTVNGGVDFKVVPSAGDFDGDGIPDIVLQHPNTRQSAIWHMTGPRVTSGEFLPITSDFDIVGSADFNRDGKPDLVLQNMQTGDIAFWYMNDTVINAGVYLTDLAGNRQRVPTGYRIAGCADFDGDGFVDLVLANDLTGQIVVWYLTDTPNTTAKTGAAFAWERSLDAVPALGYRVAGAADFDGDGHPDIVLQNEANGAIAIWYLWETQDFREKVQVKAGRWVTTNPGIQYKVAAVCDADGDGVPDIVVANPVTGTLALWTMGGEGGATPILGAWIDANTGPFAVRGVK